MTIINSSKKFTAKETYAMTKNATITKMTAHKGEIFEVRDWCLYEDVDRNGEVREILSIMTAEGDVIATNSDTFKREFMDMVDMFAAAGEPLAPIAVVSGTAKSGREFITCALAD